DRRLRGAAADRGRGLLGPPAGAGDRLAESGGAAAVQARTPRARLGGARGRSPRAARAARAGGGAGLRIVVAVKQIKVLGDEVEFADDGRDVDPDFLDRALNEWDACATEEAIRVRERLGEGEVVVVTVGDDETEGAL